MSDIQKVIKYLAIIFAIYLVVIIVGGILTFFGNFIFMFGSDKGITEDMKGLTLDNTHEIRELYIDVKGTNLIIEEGETIAVETNNSFIETHQNGNKLTIKEKGHSWLRNNNESKLIVYLPNNLNLDVFNINAGAGRIEVDSIIAKDIKLELGAGQVIINNLEVSGKAKINGGAGEMIIKDGIINNLDFDMGVGHAEITANLIGNNDIEAGVGELEIKILGSEDDYEIKVDKGIGRIELDGKVLNSNYKYGTGPNKIDIDGGVGRISINFITNYNETPDNSNETNKKYFTKTYKVLNKTSYGEEDSYYLTLQLFQGEVDTVIVKKLKENIVEGKTYEFTFEKDTSKKIEDNIKSIFSNYQIVEVKETNKVGLDQVQESIN